MDETSSPHESIPAHTTPTWEMELLVSGATILGLLQLPELLDHGYFRAVNFMPPDYANVLTIAWMYAKIAVITLVLTFLAHLCLRGYWVALVGMNSVYPGGIRWERLGLGPVTRERFSEGAGPAQQIAEAIERADNRATRVFGVGFSFAMLMLAPLLLAFLALLLSLAVNALFGEGHTVGVILAVGSLVLVPWIFAAIIDRRMAGLVARWPWLRRSIGGVAGFYSRRGFGPRSNPLVALFASNVGRLRFLATAMAVLMAVALVSMAASRGKVPFGLFAGLSAGDPFSGTTSPAAFYDDQRGNGWAIDPVPHVPSRVVSGPYLDLFVPFIPRMQARVLRASCSGLPAGNSAARARLDCLGRLAAIRVDGQPVSVPLDATTDPRTGQSGVLAMIPVGALAPGRHELSLADPDPEPSRDGIVRRYRIPFWK